MSYDFTEANSFLKNCVSQQELYDDVCAALCHVQDIEYIYGETAASQEILGVLLTVTDFLQTITSK